jgi:plasmid stabilization system protein ParE
MPRGDKSKYTDKQKRQAEHIEEGYKDRGVSEKEAESRAWATVNASSGGGKKSGSGRGKSENKAPARKGGQKGGAASKSRSTSSSRGSSSKSTRSSSGKRSTGSYVGARRAEAAKKGWETRRRNQRNKKAA